MSAIPAPGPERRAALAAAALLGLLLLQVLWPSPIVLPEAPSVALRRPRPDVVAAVAPPYPGLVPGALFSPDRRPSADGGDTAAGALDAYALLGVGLSPRGASALLKGPGGLVTLRPGQDLGGWRLAQVARDRILWVQSGRQRTMRVGEKPQPTVSDPATAEAQP